MKPITAPLQLGQTGSEVATLQEILLLMINTGGMNIDDDMTIIDRLAAEREKSLLGSGTATLVNKVRVMYGIDDAQGPELVNQGVINALNAKLAILQPATFTVSGRVAHISGKPLQDAYTATICFIAYPETIILGETPVEGNGTYRFELSLENAPPAISDPSTTNGIRVFIKDQLTEITVATMDVFATSDTIEANLTIEGNDIPVATEYLGISTALQQAIGDENSIAGIAVEQEGLLTLMVNRTGEQALSIRKMVLAHRLQVKISSIDASLFYALLRQNLPETPEALATFPVSAFDTALTIAAQNNIIPPMDATATGAAAIVIQAAIAQYMLATIISRDPRESGIDQLMLDAAAGDTYTAALLMKEYQAALNTPDISLTDILTNSGIAQPIIQQTTQSIQLLSLTGGNALIVQRALLMLDGYSTQVATIPLPEGAGANAGPEVLALLSQQDWRLVIDQLQGNAAFFFPDFIVEESNENPNAAYARFIEDQFNLTYPAQSVIKSVTADAATPFVQLKSSLNLFVQANPEFDFRTVPVNELSTAGTYNFSMVANKDTFLAEAGIVQRLMNVTQDQSLITALAKDGLHSSLQISRIAPADFVATYQTIAGSALTAQAVHDTATFKTNYTFTTALDFYNQTASPNLFALSSLQSAPGNILAEWRALFGAIDSCNCSQCQSVYSPAAYLTDLLQFLKNSLPKAYEALVARRPDIVDIDLVCKNINTPVPHIDIVNELLEDLVSAVSHTRLNPADYTTKSYRMYARQTVGDAAKQRAIPEYVNTDPDDPTNPASGMEVRTWNGTGYDKIRVKTPYAALRESVYPAVLPYNFYQRQTEAYLGISGVKGREIRQRFSQEDQLEGWKNSKLAATYLGISMEERQIIISKDDNPYAYYGLQVNIVYNAQGEDLYYVPDPAVRGAMYPAGQPLMINAHPNVNFPGRRSSWIDQLAFRVDVFMQQAERSYIELQTLLDCYCINPKINGTSSRKMAIISNEPGVQHTNSCDLSKLQIQGLDLAAVKMIYRFVRLSKALGWSFYELDKALISISGLAMDDTILVQAGNLTIDESRFNQLVQIHRLSGLLGLSVGEIGLFWADIDDVLIYRDYNKEAAETISSSYTQLFRNPQQNNLNTDYPFKERAAALNLAGLNSNANNEQFHNYLSGVFGLPADELKQLIGAIFMDGNIIAGAQNLTGMSMLYREILLLKALRLSVNEWLQYKNWISVALNFNTSPASGADVYENAASPFATPFDTLRFIQFVNTHKEAGITIEEVGYLLLDAFADQMDEARQNELFAGMLTSLRTELQKKTAPDYQAEKDTDGSVLKQLLQQILPADTADYLVKVLQDDPEIASDILTDRRAFLEEGVVFLTASDIIALTTYTTTVAARQQQVYELIKTVLEEAIRRPFIISFFSKELKVDEEIIAALMEQCIQLPTAPNNTAEITALKGFMDPAFINGNTIIARTETTTTILHQFTALVQLQKAAWLITRFRLDLQDVINLWSKSPVVPGLFRLAALPVAATAGSLVIPDTISAKPVPYFQWLAFLRWMQVITFLRTRKQLLYEAIKNIPQPTVPTPLAERKSLTVAGIAQAFNMDLADLETLLGSSSAGSLNVLFSTDTTTANPYNVSKLYLRIIGCLELQHLLPAPMSALARIADVILAPGTQQDANEVMQLVKAQYDEQQWLEVIRPVNDVLRTERRDAMVGYLLLNRPYQYREIWRTSNDIFETLMVDVEMMSCMATTRVLLAVNTIQLWVDRILLGLEKYLVSGTQQTLLLGKPEARQWAMWRKLYRVWEANRKIFLYPENWIEPDLRDDKSPFFKELEKFLKQNELTADNVEEAYRTYLERLEEVAHLEVISIYREVDVAGRIIIHAFGRTAANPNIYFYRKRIDTEWQPWEKMEVQIDGDHFVPIVWRGKLRFYWLTFMKEQKTERISNSKDFKEFIPPAPSRWKINLSFTEYKNSRWSAKQMSKDALYTYDLVEEDPASKQHIKECGIANMAAPTNSYNPNRFWCLNGSLEKQKRERITFYAGINTSGDIQFSLSERVKLISQKEMFISFFSVSNNFAEIPGVVFNDVIEDFKNKEYYTLTDIVPLGTFTHKFNGLVSNTKPFTEYNIYGEYGKALQIAAARDLRHHNYGYDYTRFRFDKKGLSGYINHPDGYYHFPDNNVLLLNKAPDTDFTGGKLDGKYLIFPLVKPEKYVEGTPISFPAFFYTDYNNNFFVEQVFVERFSLMNGPDPDDAPIQYNKPLNSWGYTLKYHFQEFSHGAVEQFRECLYKNGLDDLLKLGFITSLTDDIYFSNTYKPTTAVLQGTNNRMYPNSKVDFSLTGAYALYNWELFFHIPMLIANKLTQDQKFEEARKWYHYVFNPSIGGAGTVADFWNFPVFHDQATNIPTPLQLMTDPGLGTAVARWANDPFKPHLVARTRFSAYMKNTVMKYLDNLVAWGDTLFRTDTRENINEATLLYVLAAQLLGRRPAQVPARSTPVAQTYQSLIYAAGPNGLNAFSNGLVNVENMFLSTGATKVNVSPVKGAPPVLPDSMFYFCIPGNDKLAGYWDIIADRLFKIRNCRNIEGIERELALFDPPIDPGLLVKAAAAGLSLNAALADINAPLPAYRFNVMSQKATELTQEVKALGSQLLAALEKKDAEQLSLLRSSQELTMLNLVTEVKEQQVADNVAQINGLQQQQKITTQRRDYYKRLIDTGLSVQEQLNLDSLQTSIPLNLAQGAMQTLSGIMNAFPDITIGGLSSGITAGGNNLGPLTAAAASALGTAANINATNGQMAATKGSYSRRKEDWDQQLKTAETELKQLDYQILGGQIRQAMAEMELRNHKVQMSNARQMDDAMRNKYTNEELYDWMVGEISLTYFQAYKLAMDVSKRAERCYRYELGLETADFIQPAYWDSLKKGLLAGEQLMYDVKRMEVSFLEKNRRQLELTKHISLAQLCPDELLKLKTEKQCDISIPEWLFDMDYPGHHQRRIKSVTVSIPCVAGPYTTVSCKLSLVSSKYRKSGISTDDYNNELNFTQLYGSIQSIATSHAQNDSGMFEFSFRDERYLPFEGAGAISKWRIELPAVYAQFDRNSIADVILHVNYTARDEGGLLKEKAAEQVKTVLTTAAKDNGFMRLFSMKKEFANEWFAYSNAFRTNNAATLQIKLQPALFPYYTTGSGVEITGLAIGIVPKTSLTENYSLQVTYKEGDVYTIPFNLDNLQPGSLHPYLLIEGNVKLLKIQLLDSSDNPVNMDELLNELHIIALCRLQDGLLQTAPDDTNWGLVAQTPQDEAPDPLVAPELTASLAGNFTVLTWPAVANATSYIVERSKKNTFPTYATKVVYNGPLLTVTVPALENGKPGFFRIKALSKNGVPDSTWSTSVTINPSDDELPAQVIGKMLAWWKADAIDNTVSGNLLEVWKDQSGLGNDIPAADAGKRPEIIAGWSNNRPALKFNSAHALRMSMLNLPNNTADITVFLAGEKTSQVDGCVFELSDDTNVDKGLFFFMNDGGLDSAAVRANGGYNIHGIPIDPNQQNGPKGIYCISCNMTDADPETSIELNEIRYVAPTTYNVVQSDHVNTFFDSKPFNIGSRAGSLYYADFNLAEMIIMPFKATDQERTTIKNYLKSKYGF